jgi:hypothetical protein
MRRPRLSLSLSLRTLVELVALVAVGFGFYRLYEDSRPPWPAVRALERGDEAGRIAALRSLIYQADTAGAAVPALRRAARSDPSPAVRRGAIHALLYQAVDLPRPIDPTLERLTDPMRPAPTPGRPTPPETLRLGADAAALAIVEAMQADRDPSVRVYAVRALRRLLHRATAARIVAEARRARPAKGKSLLAQIHARMDALATGPWVLAATRAVIDRTRDPDPEVRQHAVGFLLTSYAARGLLPPDEQRAALMALVRPDAPALPIGLDLLVLARAGGLMDAGQPEAREWIALVQSRQDRPAQLPQPTDRQGTDDVAAEARGAYRRLLWAMSPSEDTLRADPDLWPQLLPSLRGDRQEAVNAAWRGELFVEGVQLYTAGSRRFTQGRASGASYEGGLTPLPEPRRNAMEAIRRDPRLLDRIWPALDRAARLSWLIDERDAEARGWTPVLERLAAEGVRSSRPPEECAAIVARLLDEPTPGADEADRTMLDDLSRRLQLPGIRRTPRSAPLSGSPGKQLAVARLLAATGYFARGAPAASEPVARLVERLRNGLAVSSLETARLAIGTLASLGPAAEPALAELRKMAASDPDEEIRDAAREAVAAITGTPLPDAPAEADDDQP